MKKTMFFLVSIVGMLMCSAQVNYTSYVNPFIGTGGHGHTYPGAVVPHGMVQLSPDTRLEGWDGCSGYHYSDNFIYGFSHTHLSGTGVSDYGDILLMPFTGDPSPDNKVYGSHFSHGKEKAKAGYYSVHLDDDQIDVELTTTARVGIHRYNFPGTRGKVILDLKHRDEVLESSLRQEDSVTISGLRRSRAWATNQYVYFVMRFSRPVKSIGVYVNDELQKQTVKDYKQQKNLKAFMEFDLEPGSPLLVKVAISQVSVEGAHKNLAAELPGWDFDGIKSAANEAWNTALSKIEIKGGNKSDLTTFYTSLYHTMVVPNIANDVDGQYRGRDLKVHKIAGGDYYSVFSLWDTYRAANPLYTIIDRKRTLDYIRTFLLQYQQGGRLPVWELSSNETDCMIGYHSVPVIVDAFKKGITGFDQQLALQAMIKSATWNHLGLPAYMKKGFIETGDENESVSKTLEYAYDDWCIAQFAKDLGNTDVYKTYIRRAQYYKNMLDPGTGFMRPRKNGDWLSPFDPREVNNNFTEANSWQYSFYVPQDISGFAALLGGMRKMEDRLDSLFSVTSETTGRDQSDITGLVGQYAHGNEPSHHISYLYNFAGAPWKTQKMVNRLMNEMYHENPDGLSGNEDCGQMSAWYAMSALGFYMVTPGSNEYVLGTPRFPEAIIHLENGKTFTIRANGVSNESYFIQSATLNGKAYTKSYFTHNDLANGGSLVFQMGPQPSTFGATQVPVSSITEDLIVTNPVIEGGNDMSFSGTRTVTIHGNQPRVKIYYTVDGKYPNSKATLYKKPVAINSSTTIKAVAINDAGKSSKITIANFHHRQNNYSIISISPFEPQYNGGGSDALLDELTGDANWRKGNHWQGFQHNDMEVVIDMKKETSISRVTTGFLQDSRAWIIMPRTLRVEVSTDGKNFKEVYSGKDFLSIKDMKPQTKNVEASFSPTNTRYVRVTATQYGKLPSWFEEGGGGQSHIFADEIQIK